MSFAFCALSFPFRTMISGALPIAVLRTTGSRLPGRRFCFGRRGLHHRVGMIGHYRYVFPDQLLDIAQQWLFFSIAKDNGLPAGPCPAGPADAVHIGFRYLRQFVDDHMR